MINAIAISLIFTSLLAAQVWGPNPAVKQQQIISDKDQDVIVKEGRRVIVVESYDQNGHHNTKVSISPPLDPISKIDGKFPSGFMEDGKDMTKQGISHSHSAQKYAGGGGHGPGELICDTFDNCKHKMSRVLGKVVDQTVETVKAGCDMKEAAYKVKDKVEDAYGIATEKAHEAKEAVEDTYGKAKEKASEKAHVAKEAVEDAYGKAKETASEKGPRAKEAVGDAYGKATENAHVAKESVENTYGKVADTASEKSHVAKEAVENVYGKTRDTASEKAHAAKEAVEDVYEKARDTASEKARGAKEAVEDAYGKVTEKAHGAKEAVEDAYGKARDTATEKVHGAKEAVEDAYGRTKDFVAREGHDVKETTAKLRQAKDRVKTTKDVCKTIRIHAARNVTEQLGHLKNITGRAGRFIFGGLKDGISYVVAGQWVDILMGVMSLLGLSTAYGMGIWVTFVSSHVLASSLPRQQFGLVQSKIYPVYFRGMGLSITMALLGHIGGHRSKVFSGGKSELLQICNLLASVLAVSLNAFYLEPLATKVMFEKFRLEKEEGRGSEMRAPETSGEEEAVMTTRAISEAEEQEQRETREKMMRMEKRLKRLNSYSAFLNIFVLMGLSWFLVDVAHCVRGTC